MQEVGVAGMPEESPEAESQDLKRLGDRPEDRDVEIGIVNDVEARRRGLFAACPGFDGGVGRPGERPRP
jgi:hypothetical protein